jgi:hypothetical protein
MNPVTVAFTEAAARLDFGFEPAFVLDLPDGTAIETLGWVQHFGSSAGTLLFAADAGPGREQLEGIGAMGYFLSLLSPSYEHYEESLFTGTLDDWGFYGPESDRPDWYTGQPWS